EPLGALGTRAQLPGRAAPPGPRGVGAGVGSPHGDAGVDALVAAELLNVGPRDEPAERMPDQVHAGGAGPVEDVLDVAGQLRSELLYLVSDHVVVHRVDVAETVPSQRAAHHQEPRSVMEV